MGTLGVSTESGYFSKYCVSISFLTFGIQGGGTSLLYTISQSTPLNHQWALTSSAPFEVHPNQIDRSAVKKLLIRSQPFASMYGGNS